MRESAILASELLARRAELLSAVVIVARLNVDGRAGLVFDVVKGQAVGAFESNCVVFHKYSLVLEAPLPLRGFPL